MFASKQAAAGFGCAGAEVSAVDELTRINKGTPGPIKKHVMPNSVYCSSDQVVITRAALLRDVLAVLL